MKKNNSDSLERTWLALAKYKFKKRVIASRKENLRAEKTLPNIKKIRKINENI